MMMADETPILAAVFDDVAPDAADVLDVYGRSTPIVSLRYSELLELTADYAADGVAALTEGFALR